MWNVLSLGRLCEAFQILKLNEFKTLNNDKNPVYLQVMSMNMNNLGCFYLM